MPKKHAQSNKTRKRKGKDLDEIAEDLQPEKCAKLTNEQPVDYDLPGDGQHYCVECVRYFVDDVTLAKHKKGKPHKQRLKALLEAPYSQREADAAVGLGQYDRSTMGMEQSSKKKMKKARHYDSGVALASSSS